MSVRKLITVLSVGMMMSASAALAGTKVQMNLVPSSSVNPPANPTMSRSKGKILILDKGKLSVMLSDVTDAAGNLVTTTQFFNLGAKMSTPTLQLDGSEYVVVMVIDVPALPVLVSGFPEQVQVVVPVDLKSGKGKTTIDLSPFLSQIPTGSGIGRSIGFVGAQVWGPIGGTPGAVGLGATACMASFPLPPAPIELLVGDTSCTSVNGGVQLGFGGINLPGN